MPKTEIETSEFTVREVYCLMSGIPICGAESFKIAARLGEFLIGVACPVAAVPTEEDTEELKAYVIWSMLIGDMAVEHVYLQMRRQYPAVRIIPELPDFMPEGYSDEDVLKKTKDLLAFIDEHGLDLDYSMELMPLPKAKRKRAARKYDDAGYHDECFMRIDAMLEKYQV